MRITRSLFLETTDIFGVLQLVSRMQGVAVFSQHLVSGIPFVKSGTRILALSRAWLDAISFVSKYHLADKSWGLLQLYLVFISPCYTTVHVTCDNICEKAQYAILLLLTAL